MPYTDPEIRRQKGRESYQRRLAADPEGFRAKVREQSRRYRAANPEKARQQVRDSQRRRRAADPEGVRMYDRQLRAANPERDRARRARWRHGSEIAAAFTVMWDEQGGCCYLCGDALTREDVNVDHDHSCCPATKSCAACRRGLACSRCNALIGLADDDPDRLRRIAASLERVLASTRSRIAAKPQQMQLSISTDID